MQDEWVSESKGIVSPVCPCVLFAPVSSDTRNGAKHLGHAQLKLVEQVTKGKRKANFPVIQSLFS